MGTVFPFHINCYRRQHMLEMLSEMCLKVSLEIIADKVVKKDPMEYIMIAVMILKRLLV